jgi:hypothetical protein
MSFIEKLPRIVQLVLLGITVLVVILFFVGNANPETVTYNDIDYVVSGNISLLLIWSYILLAISIICTLVFVVVKFVSDAIEDPKSAIKPLSILIGGILLFVIAYALGDNTPLNLPGYDGTDNQAPWLKLTDMLLYVTYTLGVVAVLALIYTGISKYFNR